MSEHIETNAHEVEARLAAIARRAAEPVPALAPMLDVMRRQEAEIFASYGGKYVRSGALEASLTGGGGGAVARLTPRGLEFGSNIPYAQYQGTEGPGQHSGPSAILKLTGEEREMAPALMGAYIMHGGRA